ncbi:hypothetical protein AVEN_155776-1 [Araneus ventricosus]|uniref:Uncharacterized protein n=1 Tax=Araneus ventricosus TaxID=182803 RepID=A0A4Y2TJC4_ARAVE|nr:hypothetical protein AVEN_155776-1 [Araneus ventricosus]
MAGETAEDEAHLICTEKSFELECFKLYDRLISEIKSRSDIYHTISFDFSFLSGKALNESSISYLEKSAADSGAKYNRDMDTLKLVSEVATCKFRVKELVKNISIARFPSGYFESCLKVWVKKCLSEHRNSITDIYDNACEC